MGIFSYEAVPTRPTRLMYGGLSRSADNLSGDSSQQVEPPLRTLVHPWSAISS